MPKWFVVFFAVVVSLLACGQVVGSVAGLINHDYLTAVLTGIGAVISFNVLYGVWKAHRRVAEATRRLHMTEMEMRRMLASAADPAGVMVSYMYDENAINKAEHNLTKIAKALGATKNGSGYILETPGGSFRVQSGHVYRKDGGTFSGSDGTCYHNGHHMPPSELIASALLLLHNDPSIYDRWKRQDGFYK